MNTQLDILMNQTKESIFQRDTRHSRNNSNTKISSLSKKIEILNLKSKKKTNSRKLYLEKKYLEVETQLHLEKNKSLTSGIRMELDKIDNEVDASKDILK
jgi:hypothetical protein